MSGKRKPAALGVRRASENVPKPGGCGREDDSKRGSAFQRPVVQRAHDELEDLENIRGQNQRLTPDEAGRRGAQMLEAAVSVGRQAVQLWPTDPEAALSALQAAGKYARRAALYEERARAKE